MATTATLVGKSTFIGWTDKIEPFTLIWLFADVVKLSWKPFWAIIGALSIIGNAHSGTFSKTRIVIGLTIDATHRRIDFKTCATMGS